jgi:hypothetical protein
MISIMTKRWSLFTRLVTEEKFINKNYLHLSDVASHLTSDEIEKDI